MPCHGVCFPSSSYLGLSLMTLGAAADVMVLQAGAGFWSQHEVVSDRAWQIQRQALHADHKAKHRAAAKHTHKRSKPHLT